MSSILSVNHLSKEYGSVLALRNVSMEFNGGEIHGLLGANGAGKSTLCKMIAGAIEPTSGEITIDGQVHEKLSPIAARKAGISMVYQEFNLASELTISENLFMGKELVKGPFILTKQMINHSNKIFKEMGVTMDSRKKIKELSVAQNQLVEIAKALIENSKVLILDEPTAPLSNMEVNILFDVLRNLKSTGIAIIYISHRLDEIFQICDVLSVLRDSEYINTLRVSETTKENLIQLMIGREITQEFPERSVDKYGEKPEVVLRVNNLSTDKLKNVSFELRKGEILGIAGLVGSGRTEIARALFGADKILGGEIHAHGKLVEIKDPASSIKQGICLVPEDRKRDGLMLSLPIATNISIAIIDQLSKFSFVLPREEKIRINEQVKLLSIKTASTKEPVSSLSGGNQQKIVLAKWLLTNSDIIIFDEPTRGIDVGTKREIYDLLFMLKDSGKSVILISSEISEIIHLSTRVIVMHEGSLQGELDYTEVTEDRLLAMASGL
jgi:ribose transport system ATP-binding protein